MPVLASLVESLQIVEFGSDCNYCKN